MNNIHTPKFLGIDIKNTINLVSKKFSRTGDFLIVYSYAHDTKVDIDGSIAELRDYIECCTNAISDSIITIIRKKKINKPELETLRFQLNSSLSDLSNFSESLIDLETTIRDHNDRRNLLETLLEDIDCFDETYISALRNY